ncbi:IclR family transcriptional regulator [Sporomusa sp.]|uniref:IclR family transcriptional regulator n=1 Tax=Sporomusa sp. TaxID=2078658 RepID=UPI002D80866D|nr:IclR family transcriptional regulator [Sporomusa sp.]
MRNSTNDSKQIQSIARAVSILDHLAANGNEDSLSNISRTIGLSKSTTYSIIATLEQLGLVQQDQTSARYSLGMKLFELGQIVHSSMDIRKLAVPPLRELVAKHGETAHLGVLSQGEVVYIDKVASLHSIGISSQIGGRNPAHCTGVGKMLISGLADEEVEKIVSEKKLKKFTEKTITDGAALQQHLQKIRQQGFAVDDEEIESGLRCIAAPIRDHRRKVIAAISLSGPTQRMNPEKLDQIIADVVDTANTISTQLGYKR